MNVESKGSLQHRLIELEDQNGELNHDLVLAIASLNEAIRAIDVMLGAINVLKELMTPHTKSWMEKGKTNDRRTE